MATAARVGFKTKPYDIPKPTQTLKRLDAANVALILLTRENVLKQSLSRITGGILHARTGGFNAHAPDQTVRTAYVEPLDLVAFANIYMANQETMRFIYQHWSNPKLHIRYEDLLERGAETAARLSDLLEIDLPAPRSVFVKNTADELSEAIENYSDIEMAIRGTHLERYLR